jgi:hypothetical protein
VANSGLTNTSGAIRLATATTNQLGGIKVDGVTITINGSGVISANITGAIVFQGGWDAATNTPTLNNVASAYNTNGFEFVCTASGTVNFGATSPVFTGISVSSITKSGTNAVGNIGSSSSYFNRVFATATTALYADVAERFAADTEYAPGTVVELGGTEEITKSLDELSENVFGVISTRAAFLMNGGAGEDDTHPPVAMTGRVPVRCVGLVNKGDRLVSAGNGLARAALPGEATAFNTIGRALVSKVESNESMVEAIVTIK